MGSNPTSSARFLIKVLIINQKKCDGTSCPTFITPTLSLAIPPKNIAPAIRRVQELAIHTVGGVVASGETMMLIVPQTDDLVIDAQVPPMRIDDVSLGQSVVIHFSAFDRNTTPECHGTVNRLSPDLVEDAANNTAYYEARINITDEAICLKAATRLIPGMPAELHIQTGDRTIWSYLMNPSPISSPGRSGNKWETGIQPLEREMWFCSEAEA
ncbi:HlyD family efflux transporter periplasmic adaptor subunit [Mesorhizobium sp. AR07]|uniref:HlyD family efflux transporter periplasmic adaptor subunit n=1 Tax=Mesorhizobium sp. AR07 TaxID=2865838 RepID=UPI00215ECE3F|nr:HlyD family efflux transporter periplasmic adaptor subunit [Mesorhizobium sp. AR07]UVK45305.1 HlyD family efflux transporter periplasmic adaptor subunit [Mesorhizobium sp. AR07]